MACATQTCKERLNGMLCGLERQQRCGTWFSPCFELHETKELTLRCEEEGRLAPETSHAGIIRIGFEGISQPHFVEHPCFNNLIETLTARFQQTGPGKSDNSKWTTTRAMR